MDLNLLSKNVKQARSLLTKNERKATSLLRQLDAANEAVAKSRSQLETARNSLAAAARQINQENQS
jgi:hypothetical protein